MGIVKNIFPKLWINILTLWNLCSIVKPQGVFVVYKNLKALRESLGMTQEEFGKSIGIAKSTYNNYEKGIREPKSDFWVAVAQKYNVTIDYLMGYSDDPHGTVARTSRVPTVLGRRLEELFKSKVASTDSLTEGDTFWGGHLTVAGVHASKNGGFSVDFEVDGTGLNAMELEIILNKLNGVEKETNIPIEYFAEIIDLLQKMVKGIAHVPASEPPMEKNRQEETAPGAADTKDGL